MNNLIHVSDTLLSDHSKEAYGCRYRGYKEWWTQAELDAEHDRLAKICSDNWAEQIGYEVEAQRQFEKRITDVINVGAKNRETALAWMFERHTNNEYYFRDLESDLYAEGIAIPFWESYMAEIEQAIGV